MAPTASWVSGGYGDVEEEVVGEDLRGVCDEELQLVLRVDLAELREALEELVAGEVVLEAHFFEADVRLRPVDLRDQVCCVFRFSVSLDYWGGSLLR